MTLLVAILVTLGICLLLGAITLAIFKQWQCFPLAIVAATLLMSAGVLIPSVDQEFCEEDNNGIYSTVDYTKMCSVPDLNGEYVVHQIINVDGERKLARFSQFPAEVNK